jgi:hypothetical protein
LHQVVREHFETFRAQAAGLRNGEGLARFVEQAALARSAPASLAEALAETGELVKAGAIGRVVQTVGLGPHWMTPKSRPAWFFERARYGGILCDIAWHQADQFLFFTGSTRADVVAAQVGNLNYPQ